MASSRAYITFDELFPEVATFKIDGTSITADTNRYGGGQGSAQIGMLVSLTADGTVGLGSDGDYPLGVLVKVDPDGYCSVNVGGAMQMPYEPENDPPVLGRGVQVDGSGNAISPAGGARLATERGTVLSLDSTNEIAWVLF